MEKLFVPNPSIAVAVVSVDLPSGIIACTAELKGISWSELEAEDMGRIMNNSLLSH